ncbi:MAG: hypothetical protein ABIH88_01970 [Patescibacteria group bacterium]
MNITNLIQTINSLEHLAKEEKENLVNVLKTKGLTDQLKKRIKELFEQELDRVDSELAKEIDQSLSVAQKEFDQEIKVVNEVLDDVEEAVARQKIAEA